jgi:hypothetical protein
MEARTLKVPQFSGAPEDFQVWFMQFWAYASLHQFSGALKDTAESSLPANEEEEPGDTKEQKAARKRNLTAMYNFTLAFSTEGLCGMIFKAMTAEWPSGKAHLVIKALNEKYRPKDTISRVELRGMLNKVSMNQKEHPSKLFEELHRIENRFNDPNNRIKIDPEDLIACAIAAAPDKYQSVIAVQSEMKGDLLTLEDVEMAMLNYWRITNKNEEKTEVDEDDQEVILGATDSKNITVKCYQCGKFGHYKTDCWDNPRYEGDIPECYTLKREWYKKKGEVSASAVVGTQGGNKHGTRYEVLF